jgi:predicted DNA binding CopG/RHH family protein
MKIRQSINENFTKLQEKVAIGKLRRLTVELEEQDVRKLKAKAAIEGLNMADIVRKLIKDHI